MRVSLFFAFAAALIADPAFAQTSSADPVVDSVMRTYGLAETDARAQLSLLDEANRLGNRLAVEEPTRYSGLRVVRGKTTRIYVRLVGDADQLLAKYTTNPAFVAEKADIPLTALRNKQEALIRALHGLSNYAVGLDVAVGRIRVATREPDAARSKLRAGNLLTGEVDVEQAADVYDETATVIGGYQVQGKYWPLADGSGNVRDLATGGFTVKNSAGTRGILTAGHFDQCKFSVTVSSCTPNSPAVDARTGVTLTYQGQQLGGDLDYEWRTSTGNTFTNQIYYGANMSVTQVLDARAYQAGTLTVCKMGSATGYTCGTVMDCNFWAVDTADGINGYFCRVHNNAGGGMADHGDSGGPVFASGTAFGIVSSRISGGTYTGDMCFMPIQKISGLGLSVLTTP